MVRTQEKGKQKNGGVLSPSQMESYPYLVQLQRHKTIGNEMSNGIVGSAPCLPPPANLKTTNTSPSPSPVLIPNTADDGYKWRLVISYEGTRYAGWQYQKWPPTVQCAVEDALTLATKLKRGDLRLVAASRTDKGVHALGQVAHLVTPFDFNDLGSNHDSLNGLLPCDIRIREISPAHAQFHARFSVKSKVYHYKIYQDTVMDPFLRLYAYHCPYKLNVDAMREAAKYLVGVHDFSAFANATHEDRVVRNPVKNILRFDVNQMGALLQLEVEGSGFLYRQVRNMVALLIQIGKEAIPPNIVPMILESRDRRELAKYSFFLPPHGLYLESVKYREEHLQLPSGCSTGRRHTITKCKLPFY